MQKVTMPQSYVCGVMDIHILKWIREERGPAEKSSVALQHSPASIMGIPNQGSDFQEQIIFSTGGYTTL
jgi:hypothetical protein